MLGQFPYLATRQPPGGGRMSVVVTEKTGNQGRNYRLPSKQDYQAVFEAQKQLEG